MNAILKLITTDEQRMAIIAELLMDDGLLAVLKTALNSSMENSTLDPEHANKAETNYALLYAIVDSYLYPESYEDED